MQDDTLKRFEAFVNGLDAQADQPPADVLDLTKASATFDALITDKPGIAPHIASNARLMMTTALIGTTPTLSDAISQLNDIALELTYIESMRSVHGDQLVDLALGDARTSCRTFYHSLQLRLMSVHVTSVFTQLADALAPALAQFSERMQDVYNAMNGDATEADNRHARRSAKYADRQCKEADQKWKRRYRIRRH